MNRLVAGLLIFVISLILFIGSGLLISFNQEPAKGSSELPECLHTDITDIRILCSIIGAIGTIVSSLLILISTKGSKNESLHR